ncbi:P-loop containing nucleoside triphosphate hydrolase protein [Cyathus striatus]|nr:P-loop containing nucleoside triphosphate hydrolase protein [Cyathus striatus]
MKRTWKRKSTVTKKHDIIIDGGKPTDIIIILMGPTGVGKSTFINSLFGEDVTTVGHELRSCTSNLKHIVRPLPTDPARRLVIVDTPGFNNTYEDEEEVLKRVSVWLAASYMADMKLCGIIYLYEISQCRMLGATRKNIQMFRRLCGEEALSSVVLGTTKWSEVSDDIRNSRLLQIKQNFWKEIADCGSEVFKLENTGASAWMVVNFLLQRKMAHDVKLQLSHELVNLRKPLRETEAGQQLSYLIDSLKSKNKTNNIMKVRLHDF